MSVEQDTLLLKAGNKILSTTFCTHMKGLLLSGEVLMQLDKVR